MAGMLDYLSGGGGGGLLDFLRYNALAQQFNGGLPSDQAQYPQGVPYAQNSPPAAPVPQAPPPVISSGNERPAAPAVGFLDRVNSGLQSIGNGGSILGALTGNFTDPGTQQRVIQNRTERALVQKGVDPAIASAAVSNPEILKAMVSQLFGPNTLTPLGNGYVADRQGNIRRAYEPEDKTPEGFEKTATGLRPIAGGPKDPAYLRSVEANKGNEVGLNPVWGEDEKGNPVIGQLSKTGEFVRTKLPPGVTPSKGVDKIDLGTEWGVVSKVNGQIIGRYPKNIEGKEAAEERGKVQGQAQAELPAVEMTAKRTISQIDAFMNSKGFNEVFGSIDQYRPNFTMSNAGRDALTRFKQLSGRAFLEGRQLLKGGGAITDFESNKAEAAIARLDRSLNETDAKAALEEFKEAVREGAAKLQAKARGGAVPAPQPAPSPGAYVWTPGEGLKPAP